MADTLIPIVAPPAGTPATPLPVSLGLSGLPAPTPANGLFLDGDYTRPVPVGVPVPEFPFQSEGDSVTLAFRQPHEQAALSYVSADFTETLDNVRGAYLTGDRDFRDVGSGILAFTRTAARIPGQRTVRGNTHRYGFQYVLKTAGNSTSDSDGGDDGGGGTVTPATYKLGALSFTVDLLLVYDYFLDGSQGDYPLVEAPAYIEAGPAIEPRGLSYVDGSFPLSLEHGDYGFTVSRDPLILAEDDTYGHYAGAIYFRERKLIVGPTAAFWLANLSA